MFPSNEFSTEFAPFKLDEKKINYCAILSFFQRYHFFKEKKGFQTIYTKMLQNTRKAWLSCMWIILRRKTVFVNIFPISRVWPKKVISIQWKFSRTCSFSYLLKKITLWVILSLFLRMSLFRPKRDVFINFYEDTSKHKKSNFNFMCSFWEWTILV